MRKILFAIAALLLSSCASTQSTNTTVAGSIPSCEKITVSQTNNEKLEMPCLDGSSTINFYDIKGPILVNVWGSWCDGCKAETPYFVDIFASPTFQSGQIKLLGVDVDEHTAEDGPNFIKVSGMSWPHLNDIDKNSKIAFGIGVPVTWFIDQNGAVLYKKIGAYDSKKSLITDVERYFKVKL